MSQAVQFAAPQNLWLLLVLPLALLLLLWGARTRRRARTTWAGQLFGRLAPGYDPRREWFKLSLVLAAWGCIVLALARPQWGGEMVMMKRRGIDLMLAVDVSASMLAEDMRPNRLEQAKREISDLIDRMPGDRIGLIAFAGEAFTVCPLTLDHGTVLLLLESLNINTVSTPGTNLGGAIARAREGFVAGEDKHKALVLVTDGESHEGDPLSEAKKAKEEGLLIYAIGMGSADGEPIPERDQFGGVAGYKKDRSGHVVTSRLDEQTLLAIAQETGGRYFRGTPQTLELSTIAEELQQVEKKELEGNLTTSYEERFQWPLGLAALLLAWELVLPARRRRRGARDLAVAMRAWLLPAALSTLCIPIGVSRALAASPEVSRNAAKHNEAATQAYEAERYDEAVEKYTEALTEAPESPAISYNLGNALYREQMLDQATKALGRAAQAEDPRLRQRSLHNLGNTFFRMGKLPEAVEAYRRALAANPSDLDTKINFEKAQQMLQQQEQEKQQQQKQQQNQNGEEQQKKDGQQGEGQQNQDQQQQEREPQQDQQGDSQEQQQQPEEQETQQAPADTTSVAAGELSQEEAMRILEAMRQREEELQKERAMKARARARRVEKDW